MARHTYIALILGLYWLKGGGISIVYAYIFAIVASDASNRQTEKQIEGEEIQNVQEKIH
jgi:hypothetical protein